VKVAIRGPRDESAALRSDLTRQAISKHLHVLAGAGPVSSVRVGRENRCEFRPKPIEGVKTYLDRVSRQWDEALGRLKLLVEH
jgi:hypothetical protein